MTLVVGAVIIDNGRAFVHRRGFDRALFPGCWDIPGGHVEPGEDPLDALGREVHEETGWRLRRIVAELGEITWTGDDGVSRREIDYVVEVDGDLAAPRLERPKHTEFRWVTRHELDLLMENRRPEETTLRDIVGRGLSSSLACRVSTPASAEAGPSSTASGTPRWSAGGGDVGTAPA